MRGYDKNETGARRDADGDGVPDNRDPVVRHPPAGGDPALTREVRKDAYERGRADERSRHKRNPILTILIAIAAVFGLAVFVLFLMNGGSFTGAGRQLDQVTDRAAQEVEQGAREVADETGEALQDGGRRVEQVGETPPGGSQQPPAAATPPAQ